MNILIWFDKSWYKYLFEPKSWLGSDLSWWRIVLCRARGHPCGMIWSVDAGNQEPDTRCKNCGEDLG